MIEPLTLLAFIPAALALNLTPGADMMLCMGQGMRGGARAAWKASAGVACGGLVHGLLAGIGVAALVARHPAAFEVIRWVGAAYLLWMAWKALTSGATPDARPRRGPAFRDGLVVNLTNPKVILFNLAFVPQFVDPSRPVLPQFLVFAGVLSLGGLVVNGMAGAMAGWARGAISGPASRWFDRVSAGIFAFLALRLVLMERT